MGYAIGIDLGTTNSVIATLENNEPKVIPNTRGERITPSVVSLGKNQEILVGRLAKNQSIINKENTITSIKRKMGSGEKFKLGKKSYTPQEISAFILEALKKSAEDYLGEKITDAVITVPAYFDDNQRQATKDAGRIAGLNVLRIINEPTAAALSYGIDKANDIRVLIYDLGGGTFDVSVLDIADGVFQVLATAGNNFLGGDDFDNLLATLISNKFNEKEGIDLKKDKMAWQKLIDEVEKAKIALSEITEVEINLPFISADEKGPKHLSVMVTREQFEELITQYIDETLNLTKQAITDAKLTKKDIDKLIFVGGSTRIPLVRKKIQDFLEIECEKGINPDEVVAMGAAIQSGILLGEKKGIVLVDVNALSLGIEIEGDIFVPIIERNSTIPASSKKIFTTISDNQKCVEIHVLQGERKKASENISLGKFQLSGIRNAKKGEPRIEVEFNIDVDGIVHVSAIDLDTKATQKIEINNANMLSEEEIQKIIFEAERKKEEDLLFLEKNNKKNELIKQLNKLTELLINNYSSLSQDLINEINNFINNTNNILQSFEIELFEELNQNILFYINEITNEIEKLEDNSELVS